MATTTVSVHQRAMRSSVAKKAVMAVTGLILIGFLLMHMWGNLKMFMGPEAFDHYAEWLKGRTPDGGLLYPIMPAGWFLWIFRVFLLAAIVLHAWSAYSLTVQGHRGRGRAKRVRVEERKRTYAARTMRWGGVILAGFLIFHLLQFTVKATPVGFGKDARPYDMVLGAFSNPIVTVAYALWMITVCLHVRHGFWSAFTTLGANVSPGSRRLLNGLGIFVAVLLYVGFMAMPFCVLFGVID